MSIEDAVLESMSDKEIRLRRTLMWASLLAVVAVVVLVIDLMTKNRLLEVINVARGLELDESRDDAGRGSGAGHGDDVVPVAQPHAADRADVDGRPEQDSDPVDSAPRGPIFDVP